MFVEAAMWFGEGRGGGSGVFALYVEAAEDEWWGGVARGLYLEAVEDEQSFRIVRVCPSLSGFFRIRRGRGGGCLACGGGGGGPLCRVWEGGGRRDSGGLPCRWRRRRRPARRPATAASSAAAARLSATSWAAAGQDMVNRAYRPGQPHTRRFRASTSRIDRFDQSAY